MRDYEEARPVRRAGLPHLNWIDVVLGTIAFLAVALVAMMGLAIALWGANR